MSIAELLPILWFLGACGKHKRQQTHQDIYKTEYLDGQKMESCEEVDFGTHFNNWHPKSASF